jgi:hypothetical protein
MIYDDALEEEEAMMRGGLRINDLQKRNIEGDNGGGHSS